ncbi:septum formation initiator family protein [Streptomyces sp. NBC_01525]|uniref:septum formation initiator family protein n=1 Tax=Streptomyces sp. NBC_01525 TaxID=2903893 RepID=UPI0038673EE2
MTPRGRSPKGPSRLAALFPGGSSSAARTPFVLLVVVLLGSGLLALLLLNSALNQGSFELSRLEKRTDELTDDQQELQQAVDAVSAPGALERRARELGMVPGGNPAFLAPDGTVRGKPSEATEEPRPLHAPAGPSLPGALGASAAQGAHALAPGAPGTAPAGAPAAPGAAGAPVPSAPPRPPGSPAPAGSAAPAAPAPAAAGPAPTTSGR